MTDATVKNRDEIVADYQRAYGLRNPSAGVGPGTPVYVDAVTIADQLLPLYGDVKRDIDSTGLDEKSSAQLDQIVADKGLSPRSGETGSIGYVVLRTSTGGATIIANDSLLDPVSKATFAFTTTQLRTSGSVARIVATTKGPVGNLPAGTILQIVNPRPGCAPTCTVQAQTDGSGLSGGALAEGDESVRSRIRAQQANPAAAGNPADYVAAIRKTPGVQIEQAFVYDCPYGPGTVAWTVTMTGDDRRPTGEVLNEISLFLEDKFPGSDIKYALPLGHQNTQFCIRANFSAGWTDNSPWPRYAELTPSAGSGGIVVSAITSATSFTLAAANGNYVEWSAPSPGQSIAFYNPERGTFSRKRILSVTGTGPWAIVCDLTFGATDTSFSPIVNQRAMPWSDGLDLMVKPVKDLVKACGPGEVADLMEMGGRNLRYPLTTDQYPSGVGATLSAALNNVKGISLVQIVEGGTANAEISFPPNILFLTYLSIFPE